MAPDGNNGQNGYLWWYREIFMTCRQTYNKIRKSHTEKDLKFLLQGKLMIKKI